MGVVRVEPSALDAAAAGVRGAGAAAGAVAPQVRTGVPGSGVEVLEDAARLFRDEVAGRLGDAAQDLDALGTALLGAAGLYAAAARAATARRAAGAGVPR